MIKRDYTTADGQKRMMAESVDMPSDTYLRRAVDTGAPGDHGADPIGDGTFKMIPSGDIVDFAERNKRLAR